MSFALPAGFRFASIDAGIAKGDRLDLWLAVADEAYPAAAVFTRNQIIASPIALCREHMRLNGGMVRAMLVNAGCANACTGEQGDANAARSAELVAESIGCDAREVLVFSTGVIGQQLAVDRIEAALPRLVDSLANDAAAIDDASRAILTTDLVPKVAQERVPLESGDEATILGLAKGSGMIHPDMATMLGFVFSDFDSGRGEDILLRGAVQESFHRISVDGDTSTNDAVVLWTSASKHKAAGENAYFDGLRKVQIELAKAIARDGEGATKLIEVVCRGAQTPEDAERCARTIAQSMLVRTAVHGGDPNWGRILAAAGRSEVILDTRKCQVGIGEVTLFEDDAPRAEREPAAAAHLAGDTVTLWVDLASGEFAASFWTCDLSDGYVRINADYRS